MKRANILVVDDESDVVDMLAQFLTKRGHSVWKAYDGEAAVEVVRERGPMIVVLDVKLPRMDGLETLRAIKRLRPRTVVLMISGVATLGMARAALEMGAYDYLAKPIELKHLEDLISVIEASRFPRDGSA
jgi:DNA-binding NtrC family response regulator